MTDSIAAATSPEVAPTRVALAAHLAAARRSGRPVGFVPTMGALHDGHASLMRRARAELGPDAPVVVSIFVNPLQFGPGEDLDRYPRTLPDDLAVCRAAGVDLVFAPAVEEVYPSWPPQVTVDPGPLGQLLEGATRPGHFHGVLTVVAKLFGLVRPDLAVFGEKDYQQLALIRRMNDDLCQGVRIIGGETQREPDGLAMSSRNRYLSPEERTLAASLSAGLREAQRVATAGGTTEQARSVAAALIDVPGIELDYLVVTTPDLEPLPELPSPGTEGRVLVEARVGTTRLLDNMPLLFGATAG